ncbi:MAG: hypothetical protein ACNA8K_15525 [Cyclonatronaceae bacterium]
MKSLSKIGMMRQIATGIYQADGLIYPDKCKIKTTVDRIELQARWSGSENPPTMIRKQTLMGCGSLLYHLRRSFGRLGWSVEVRLFPKLDREDVIAYVRAGIRKAPFNDDLPDIHVPHADDSSTATGNNVILEKRVHDNEKDAAETWYFHTRDDDAIAWIRTGQAYAQLYRNISDSGQISALIPARVQSFGHNGETLINQLIVTVKS